MGALRTLCLSTGSADRICLPPFQQPVSERKAGSRQSAFIQKRNRNNLSKISVRILNYGSVLDPEESHKKQQLRTEFRFRQLHQETISEKACKNAMRQNRA